MKLYTVTRSNCALQVYNLVPLVPGPVYDGNKHAIESIKCFHRKSLAQDYIDRYCALSEFLKAEDFRIVTLEAVA